MANRKSGVDVNAARPAAFLPGHGLQFFGFFPIEGTRPGDIFLDACSRFLNLLLRALIEPAAALPQSILTGAHVAVGNATRSISHFRPSTSFI
jgi:hypothetical protein